MAAATRVESPEFMRTPHGGDDPTTGKVRRRADNGWMSRRDLLQAAADHASSYLDSVGDRRVRADATGADLPRLARRAAARRRRDAPAVIDRLAGAARGTVATQGPRYFGFVIGGSLPVATAAEWLVSAWDQNAGVYVLSPVVSVVEEIAASMGARSCGPAGVVERRVRHRLPDGELHRPRRRATSRARAAPAGTSKRAGPVRRAADRRLRQRRIALHDLQRAADARPRRRARAPHADRRSGPHARRRARRGARDRPPGRASSARRPAT